MKTITMDYDTYKKELADERLRGFEILKGLKPGLLTMLEGIRSCDSKKITEAEYAIARLLRDLEDSDK